MISLTTAHKANLERFQQNIDLRVRLFKRSALSTLTATKTGTGTKTMYIQLSGSYWLYSFLYEDPTSSLGRYTIYYSDNPKGVAIGSIAAEHWYPLISHDSMGFWHTLSFDYIKDDNGLPSTSDKTHILPALYAKYLKLVRTDNVFPDVDLVTLTIKSEDYFDITDYLVSEITRTRRMDQVVRHYQRPTAEIFLDNADGLFNRRNTSSPYYQYLKSGVRFTIDAKFMGSAWEDPAEWIPMGSFRARKFSKNDNAKTVSIYGEAGRQLSLSKTTQRIFEQVPVRKFAEYFLKDDQQQKPVCALLPRKNQVRTMVDEELGIGRFNDVEYEKSFYNAVPEGEFICACCANLNGDFWGCGQFVDVVDNASFTPKPYRLLTKGVEIFVQPITRAWSGPTMTLEYKLSITSDADNIFITDIAASKYGLSYAACYIAKINYKTGRIEDDYFGDVLMTTTGIYYGIGLIHRDSDDTLWFYKKGAMSNNYIGFYKISKSTLRYDSAYQSLTSSSLVNCIIYDGFYDALYNKFYFILSKYDTSTPPVLQKQYLMRVNSSFSTIEEKIEIMDSSSIVRMGLMIRNNKDYVASIKDGTDNWFFTFAKRQFWLKGNIQDTNGPLTDRVFYDQPEVYQDQLMDNTGVWDDYVVETDDYWLNTKTGELILKRPLKEDARLWANYDYHPSLNFPEIEDVKRYDALQQAAETENWRVIIDERENVNLKERIYEEVIPTMDYSEAYNTILTFVSDPVTGLPDEVTLGSQLIDPGYIGKGGVPTTFFDNVQKHDEIIITGGPAADLGTFLIKQKISGIKIQTYHVFVNSIEYIDGSIKRYVVTRTPKSVKLGQTYEGKGVGLLNIIHDTDHKTIRVFSMDFLEMLAENTDYTISTATGYMTINFLDTARVRNNPAVVVQYRIQEELYSIIDDHNVVTETEGWNEDTIINKVTVKGQRLLPDVTRLSIVRQYAVAPYSKQNRSDLPLIQEANSTGQFDWASDDERTDYSEKDVTKQNFLLEFEHPLIIGTTAFTVIYGNEASIEKSDTVEHTKRDAVYYWEITDTFADANYLVMISNRREFRVCTAEDYRDMVDSSGNWLVDANNDEVGYGTEPSSASDMKTAAHFYIKQMNGAYAREDTKYIVYYEKSVDYYINDQGIVIQGSITPNEDGQGVFTGYPNKAASITVTPKDSQGATLFDMHGVSGSPGYDNGANYANVNNETYALQVSRVQIDSKGANLKFNNWGEIAQYIQVGISGYPLSRVEKINVEANPTAQEITDYGERDKEIENLFIGETYQAQSLAFGLRNFFKDEKSKFRTEIMLAPHLQLEDIVEVSNPYEYLTTKLMEILEVVDHIRIGGASTSGLVIQEVEDDV